MQKSKADTDRAAAETQKSKAELDAKLADAQKRLEKAASEVAALSQEIASQVMENIGSTWSGTPRRTVIGVQLSTDADGAKVVDVSPGGAAEQAGVRTGDVIVAVNGSEVKGSTASRDVVRLLRTVKAESKVKLRVMRDGKPKDFDVVARPFDPRTFVYRYDPPPGFNPSPSPGPSPSFDPGQFNFGQFGPFNPYGVAGNLQGMELTTLTPQLGKYFGADKGVLVVRAPQNQVFKLQDGDVILNVDGRVPGSGSQLARILRSYQPGEKLVLRIMRDRKPLDMEVTVPEVDHTRGAGNPRAAFLSEDGQTL